MKTALLIVLQLAASGSDAYFTNRNAQGRNFHEADPIARPFMRTTSNRVLFFSAVAAVQVTVPVLLRKHHPKLADTLAIAGIADNTEGMIYSATH